MQEIDVTKNGTNIKHVLIHPQQRAQTQTRMHSLPGIQTHGPSPTSHAKIRLCRRIRVRRRRERRKVQDTALGTSQRLWKRKTQILIHYWRVREMGKALPALTRCRNTNTHNTKRGPCAQGGARGRSWRPASRIRLLKGETSWSGLRLSKEQYLSPTKYPSRSKDEQ